MLLLKLLQNSENGNSIGCTCHLLNQINNKEEKKFLIDDTTVISDDDSNSFNSVFEDYRKNLLRASQNFGNLNASARFKVDEESSNMVTKDIQVLLSHKEFGEDIKECEVSSSTKTPWFTKMSSRTSGYQMSLMNNSGIS